MGNDATPDAALKLALLRVESPVCLLRAASTCKQYGAAWSLMPASSVASTISTNRRSPCVTTTGTSSFGQASNPPHRLQHRRRELLLPLNFIPSNNVSYWRIRDNRGSLLRLDRHDSKDGSVDTSGQNKTMLTQSFQEITA